MKTALYIEARKYLEVWGFSVIPCGKDKRPLLPSWKEYQERKPTEQELATWWEKWPDANIGIITGAISGISVIDIDTHKGGSATPFPATFKVKTGNGGLHLYYKYHPGLTVSANAYPQYPNVDIRNDGGFVIAPPSLITPSVEDATGVYEIIDAQDFAAFPSKLFPESKKRRKISARLGVGVGARNDSMASVIGTIIRPMDGNKILTDGWEATIAINKTYLPPLPEGELETTFKSIVDAELARRSNFNKATPSPLQISPTERIDILLRKNSNSTAYKDMTNALLVLDQHPRTSKKIRYNSFKQEIEYNHEPVEDTHILSLVYLMQSEAGLPNISKETVYSAIQYYAHQNQYDEAVEWLKTLRWDGVPRLATWLIKATGIDNDSDGYHQGVGAQWLKGLVSRLLRPGCIFDYVLVLVGPQGVGKTSLFRILGGDWYKSFTGTVENKDFFLQLRGAMIMDLDEGVALYRSESIKMKSIITQTVDEYRAPYDKTVKKYPRRFVFSMSTNDTEPFRDVTGNRRYWPVEVKQPVDFKWLEDNREQLFAEAYHAVINKTPLPEVKMNVAQDRQENFLPNDEWEESIQSYVFGKSGYCYGDPEFFLTIAKIYKEALQGEKLERLERKHELRIGSILRKALGMERRRNMIGGQRTYRFYITPERCAELKKTPLVIVKDEFDSL